MIRRAIFLLPVVLALAVNASAQGAPTQSANAAAEALKPFQYLIGTWTSEYETPAGRVTLERTFRPVLGGKFIVGTEVSRTGASEAHFELWIGFDLARKAVNAWEFLSDGGYFACDSVNVAGDAIVLEGRLIGGAGLGRVRGTMRRSGNDRIAETIEAQQNGAWTTLVSRTLVRSAAAGATAVPRAAAAASPALKPLDLLAGRWGADGESDGAKYSVDYAVYWTLGGHFLRSDYSVTTNGQTETHAVAYMFLDAETKSLRQIGFSAEGGVSAMKVVTSAGSVTFDGEMVTPTRRMPMRITYARPDAATLTASTESQRQDGSWRRTPSSPFKRRP